MEGIKVIFGRCKRVSPVKLAFFGSLFLSLIAVLGVVTIGRDAAIYINAAQQMNAHGVAVAIRYFDWPWFSILLAYTNSLTGVSYELTAYLWCAFFMAGTCALLVDVVRQRVPEASYWACLVVLAMPAANQFRFDIIREFGFWFFCVLALWLALRWQGRGGWLRAVAVHVAVLMAVLFRLEALMLLPALVLWQASVMRGRECSGWLRLLQFNAFPLLMILLCGVFVVSVGGVSFARVNYYLGLLDPRRVFNSFDVLSDRLSAGFNNGYSSDLAGQIIFFGMLSALVVKFLKVVGIFCVPFLFSRSWVVVRVFWREFRPFAWVGIIYSFVLMLFFVRQHYMISRYVSLLNLLLVPLISLGVMHWARRFPRFSRVLVVISFAVMLGNVVALGAKKNHIIEAGAWVAKNVEPDAPVFYYDYRIAYYAGRDSSRGSIPLESVKAQKMLGDLKYAEKYRYYLVHAGGDESWVRDLLMQQHKRILARFTNRKGDSVLAIGD